MEAPENRVIEKICQALREKKWTDYSTKPAPDKPREIVWKPSKARASTPRVGPPIHELMAIPGGSFSSELGKKKTTTFTPAMASAAAAAAAATTPASASKIPASKTTIKSDLSKSAAQTAWNKSEAFKSDFFKNKTTADSMEVAAREMSKPKEMPRSKLPETQRHRPVLETPPETNNSTALVPTKPVILEAGTRISVFWPLDNAWYDATVKTCSVNSHYLEYDDDGEMEWLDLSKNNFKIRTEDE